MAPDTAAWTCCGVTYKGGTECPKCLTPKPTTAADEVLTDVPDDAPPYSDSYEWQPATAAWAVKHDDRWTLMTEFAVNLEARGGHRHGPNGLTYVSFGTATEVLAAVIKHRQREAHRQEALDV